MEKSNLSILLLNHVWLKEELINKGHSVITAGWRDLPYDIKFPWRCSSEEFLKLLDKNIKIDCLIYYDDSGLPCILDFENIPFKKIFYSVDTHHHLEWHKEFSRLFDLTLVAQKDFIPEFYDRCNNVEWFPPWSTRYIEPADKRTVDISFRGTMDVGLHPGRKDFFDYCSKSLSIDYGQGDYVDIYSKSKIVLNEAVRGDLNFRVFEAIMSGALLINPKIKNGLDDIFIDGKDYISFIDGDRDDVIRLCRYYLENDQERELIASNGREKLLKFHTGDKRASQLEKNIYSTISSKYLPDIKTSLELHSNILRYMWLFVKKYNQENMSKYLDDEVGYLLHILENNNINILDKTNNYEVSILITDSLLSDLLDVTSYENWLSILKNSNSNLLIVDQIYSAFKNEGNLYDADTRAMLKQLFSDNRKNFLSGLINNT